MANQDTAPVEMDPWVRAKKFVRGIGDISTSFTGCVRSLLGSGRTVSGSKFSFMTQQHLERLLRSPTVVAHLQFAALTYHKTELAALGTYTPKQMVEVFTAPELAAILSIIYLHRRLMARCDKKSWHDLAHAMQSYVDLAVPLGQTIPSIGPMRALLAGASRFLGWGMIMAQDPKGFKKYKIGIKVKGLPYNLQEELDNWGTTHVHIAATAFQAFGIGVDATSGFLRGILAKDPATLEGEELRYRVAQLWLDALIQDGAVPSGSLGDDFILSEDKTDSFIASVQNLVENGSPYSWLDKRRDDITPESLPALKFEVKKFSKPKPAESEPSEALDEELGAEEPQPT